jgi:hypothetical protein
MIKRFFEFELWWVVMLATVPIYWLVTACHYFLGGCSRGDRKRISEAWMLKNLRLKWFFEYRKQYTCCDSEGRIKRIGA